MSATVHPARNKSRAADLHPRSTNGGTRGQSPTSARGPREGARSDGTRPRWKSATATTPPDGQNTPDGGDLADQRGLEELASQTVVRDRPSGHRHRRRNAGRLVEWHDRKALPRSAGPGGRHRPAQFRPGRRRQHRSEPGRARGQGAPGRRWGCDGAGAELLRQLETAGVDTALRLPGAGSDHHHEDADQQRRPVAAALRRGRRWDSAGCPHRLGQCPCRKFSGTRTPS